jgi:hypothetical protein
VLLVSYLLAGGAAVVAGAVDFTSFFATCFFDFLAVEAVAVASFDAGAAGVAGAAVCAKEIAASASVIVIAVMVFMMF